MSDDAGNRPSVTRLIDGREVTTEELTPLLYEDLRRLASSFFGREKPGITLQPTALVHEAWMHLAGQRSQEWQDRAHFLAVAATVMRRVLIESARRRGRVKRGGDRERVTLSDVEDTGGREVDILDLEDALQKVAGIKERYARIIELRYFTGLSLEETADVLGVTRTIVVREWAKARAWLSSFLEGE